MQLKSGLAMLSLSSVLLFGHSFANSAVAQSMEPGTTQFSSVIFINASQQEPEHGNDNFNVDLKRLFINVDHQFDQNWSLHATTDINWQRYQDPSDLFVRHLYVQRTINDNMRVRLGNAPTTWIQPIAVLNGYRYLDPGLIPRAAHGSAADWGVHLLGEIGQFSYAVAAVTGAGFQKPRVGDSPDYEARLSWQPVNGLQFHVGGYRGTLTQDKDNRPHYHTAQRWNTGVTYVEGPWRVGAEYFYADNWRQINQPESDAANGTSVWGAYQINPQYAVSLRHDRINASRRLAPENQQEYYNAALEWRYSNDLRFSAVIKHIDHELPSGRQISNEFGLWALIRL